MQPMKENAQRQRECGKCWGKELKSGVSRMNLLLVELPGERKVHASY